MEIRKVDVREYGPNSLKMMISSIDWYLKSKRWLYLRIIHVLYRGTDWHLEECWTQHKQTDKYKVVFCKV